MLTKNPDILIPKVLLIDLPYDANTNKQQTLAREPSSDSIDSADNMINQQPSSQKKVVMMKRNTGSENKNMKKDLTSGKQSQAAADKAKQYAEARARIFGLEGTVESEDPGKANIESRPISVQVAKPIESVHANPPQILRTTFETSISADSISSSMKAKKALERDRGADERDPDFSRGRNFVPSTYTIQTNQPSYDLPSQMPRQSAYDAQYPTSNYYYYDNYPSNGNPGYDMPVDEGYDPYADHVSRVVDPYYHSNVPINRSEGYYPTSYASRFPTSDLAYYPPQPPQQPTTARYPAGPGLGPTLDPSDFPPLGR